MCAQTLYDLPLQPPKSRDVIKKLQSVRKRVAVERAKQSAFWKPRLSAIRLDKLDDPKEWRKIPLLTKDELRKLSDEQFYSDFCVAPRTEICEYWRSGGVTGRPLFYPRTFADIRYAMIGFARTFQAAGIKDGNVAHLSLPLGIHPAGQLWARAGQIMGVGMNWAGAGATIPSKQQLALIHMLKPTMWMGMPSYALHLANLAEAEGLKLADGSVQTMLCTAEPLSDAKRTKIARRWGAEVFDTFGMTEVSMIGAEGARHEGFHVWTDLVFIEVIHPETHEPVGPGQSGVLVVTPLFTNHATPFLRWYTGDIVFYQEEMLADAGPLSVFPRIFHAHRTAGFFKVKGVNINHAEFEDFMFKLREVNDFKAEAVATGGVDAFKVSIEVPRDVNGKDIVKQVAVLVKRQFEVEPEVAVLPIGTLAAEFETSVKAPRFVDRREQT